MLQPPISDHPGAPLPVAGGAEQALGNTLKTVTMSACRGEIIYY
jgi:hypothetical protein